MIAAMNKVELPHLRLQTVHLIVYRQITGFQRVDILPSRLVPTADPKVTVLEPESEVSQDIQTLEPGIHRIKRC